MSEILAAIPRLFGAREDGYARFIHAAVADQMAALVVEQTQRQLQTAYESTVSEIRQAQQAKRSGQSG